jgi:hypothetical protein
VGTDFLNAAGDLWCLRAILVKDRSGCSSFSLMMSRSVLNAFRRFTD